MKPKNPTLLINSIGRITNEEGDQIPEVPAGARLLRTGESVQVGDFHWGKAHEKWREVVGVIDLSVSEQQQGFYCRQKQFIKSEW